MEKSPQGKEQKEPEKTDAPTLKQSEQLNISLIIDTYDDIFSDFDPRPYHERVLSEDFLTEVRHRHLPHKKGGLEVRFLVPDSIRDQKVEAVIKRRLKAYFKEEEKELGKLLSDKRKIGYIYITVGALLLSSIAFVIVNYSNNLWARIFELLLAPAAWFGMWEGLSKVLDHEEIRESQFLLSRRLSESVFNFIPESEALKGPAPPELQSKLKEFAKEQVREVGKPRESEPPSKKIIKETIKEGLK
jgi:hypothetical protein